MLSKNFNLSQNMIRTLKAREFDPYCVPTYRIIEVQHGIMNFFFFFCFHSEDSWVTNCKMVTQCLGINILNLSTLFDLFFFFNYRYEKSSEYKLSPFREAGIQKWTFTFMEKKNPQTSVHGYQIKYNFQRLGFLFIYFFSKLSTKITKRKKKFNSTPQLTLRNYNP